MAQDISKKETTQTAVDWFFDNLKNHEVQSEHFELYQQAKKMEKKQIEVAYSNGSNDRLKNRINGQYYNETYGS